jgi:hypothetical protein
MTGQSKHGAAGRTWLITLGLLIIGLIAARSFPAWVVTLSLGALVWSIVAFVKRGESLLGLFYPPDVSERKKAIGSAAYSLVVLLTAFIAFGSQSAEKRRSAAARERQSTEARQEQALAKQKRDSLRSDAAQFAVSLTTQLEEAEASLKNANARRALIILGQAAPRVKSYMDLTPVPPEVALLIPRHRGLEKKAEAILHTLDKVERLQSLVKEAKASMKDAEWLTADTQLKEAAELGASIVVTNEAKGHLAKGVAVPKLLSEVKALSATVRPKADREAEEIARKAVYLAVCGDKPRRQWDGEYPFLEAIVRQSAHDPDSMDVENCEEAVLTESRCWRTRCDVCGKNVFGAMVRNQRTFFMSASGVESAGADN